MPRNPHSVANFFEEVQAEHKKATIEPVGDPDGFNVHRTFKFDKTSSKFLAEVLPEINDPRIDSFKEREGYVYVTFSHRTVADRRGHFALAEARSVVNAD